MLGHWFKSSKYEKNHTFHTYCGVKGKYSGITWPVRVFFFSCSPTPYYHSVEPNLGMSGKVGVRKISACNITAMSPQRLPQSKYNLSGTLQDRFLLSGRHWLKISTNVFSIQFNTCRIHCFSYDLYGYSKAMVVRFLEANSVNIIVGIR